VLCSDKSGQQRSQVNRQDSKLALGVLYEIWANVIHAHFMAIVLAIIGLVYIVESFIIGTRD